MSQPPTVARKRRAPSEPPASERASVELQLAIGPAGIGVELAHRAELGPLLVTELAASLPSASFPLDVSGGVSRFRHTRGVLERLTVELTQTQLGRWATPRLRGLLGTASPQVFIGVRSGGVTFGIFDEPSGRALGFDLLALPINDDLHLCAVNARGLFLHEPAVTLAMRAASALVGAAAEHRGSQFVIARLSGRIARALLPEAGARAPEAGEIRIASCVGATDVWILHASRRASPADANPDAVRAREACELTAEADEARRSGQLERARALDLRSLERAPRHPEICRRIADLDRLAGGRAEAAQSTLAQADGQAHGALLAGELATEAMEAARAIAALRRGAEAEVIPQLSGCAFARAAELTTDHHEALLLLDRAVARSPTSPRLRLARLTRRLSAGRTKDALADAEELEAMATGARAKHEVWRACAERWHAAGLSSEAGALFERSLRYVPDDPAASAGLGATLVAQGKVARGVALLTRAVASAQTRTDGGGAVAARWILALATALAEPLSDKPAAIARVRSISDDEPEAMVARGLEGRWRAALGDLAGAQIAFARARDLAASRLQGDPSATGEEVKLLLMEGARFERDVRGDLASAQAHLQIALQLRPSDPELAESYRAICAELTPSQTAGVIKAVTPTAPRPPQDDESRAESLILSVRANPEDDGAVDELVALLTRLGRGFELLALLSARMEEASPARRIALIPAQRSALMRMLESARDEGRELEAQLFADALGALDDPSPG